MLTRNGLVYLVRGVTPSALSLQSSIRSGQFYKQKGARRLCPSIEEMPVPTARRRAGRLGRCLKREIETSISDSLAGLEQRKTKTWRFRFHSYKAAGS